MPIVGPPPSESTALTVRPRFKSPRLRSPTHRQSLSRRVQDYIPKYGVSNRLQRLARAGRRPAAESAYNTTLQSRFPLHTLGLLVAAGSTMTDDPGIATNTRQEHRCHGGSDAFTPGRRLASEAQVGRGTAVTRAEPCRSGSTATANPNRAWKPLATLFSRVSPPPFPAPAVRVIIACETVGWNRHSHGDARRSSTGRAAISSPPGWGTVTVT